MVTILPEKEKKEGGNGARQAVAVLLSVLTVVNVFILLNTITLTKRGGREGSWSAGQIREYANKLKGDGLVEEARKAYEEYVEKGGVDKSARSNIYFTIGEMLMGAKKYDEALAYFYKAEIADPATKLKQEIGNNIVTCLERSDRALDAEYQMEKRTLLAQDKGTKKPSGEVVARIKDREITMSEINREMEQLPPWMEKAYTKNDSKKLEFLRTYVANELFYEKGMKMGYHRDPQVKQRAGEIEKELVIRKVLEDEVFSKIKSEEADLSNYYEANKEKFTDKKDGKVKAFDEARAEVEMAYRQEKAQKGLAKFMDEILSVKDVEIYSEKFKAEAPDEKAPDDEGSPEGKKEGEGLEN
ncbi:MAG: hypothetical protein HQL30_02595 [Candidatus Omnitrophica bacterium]|nr:hypothetical protein [Candidatus Omnitrophota bacterium]